MLRRKANKSRGATVVGGRVGRVEKRREERRVFMRDDGMLVPARTRYYYWMWVTAQPRCPLGCGIGSEPRVYTPPQPINACLLQLLFTVTEPAEIPQRKQGANV